MKKTLLFIIILLFPILVNANSLDSSIKSNKLENISIRKITNNNENILLYKNCSSEILKKQSLSEYSFANYSNILSINLMSYVNEQNTSNNGNISSFLIHLLGIFIGIIVAILIHRKTSVNDKYNYGIKGADLGKVNNFRDIPCNKDIFYAFWLSNVYYFNRNKTDFFGAVLLKWINDDNVKIEKENESEKSKNSEDNVIVFLKEPKSSNELEIKLYTYMQEAAKDGKLEKDEFNEWCKKNYYIILNWFDDIVIEERNNLVGNKTIYKNQYQGGKILKYNYEQYDIPDDVREEAIKLKGLKQFLEDFTRIKEKEPIEVKLWSEYLMFAQIFGIAKEVMKQFKKLYPEVIKDMSTSKCDYETFMFIDSFASEGIGAATRVTSGFSSSDIDYSSGGGGFSSGGGGGGSFGGGGSTGGR